MQTKPAPNFAHDAGVWKRTVQKISESRGVPFNEWDKEEWKAAAAYYPRAAKAQGGTKYTTGESFSLIHALSGAPVKRAGAITCPNCGEIEITHPDDYICYKCRDARDA